MERILQKYTWKDHLFNISLVLFFILPQNGLLYYYVPVAMILVTDWKKTQNDPMKPIIGMILGSLFLTLILNIASPWATSKYILKLVQLSLLLICFGRLKSVVIIKEYIIFLVFYLLIFQFAYQLNISYVSQIMQQLYPLDAEEIEKYAYRQELSFSDLGGYMERLGGIYYNSNNCASFLEMLFLLVINERKQYKKWLFFTLVALLVFGIMSTGSRTSMLVLAILLMFMFFNVEKSEKGLIVFFMLAGIGYYLTMGSGSRMFAVRQGMEDSFLIKVKILIDYLSSTDSVIRLLFGCLGTNYLVVALGSYFSGTDFDIGDAIVSYGFVFVILLIVFLWRLFKGLGQYKAFMVILIWCFSNTIFMSYRASALFLLIASMYYSRNFIEKKKFQ